MNYGNWCGPGWSAKQHKDAKDLTEEDKRIPAIDDLDQCCKEHDIELSEATTDEQVKAANDKFVQNSMLEGYRGIMMSHAVEWGGPRTVADVQGTNTHLRGSEKKRKQEEDFDSPPRKKRTDDVSMTTPDAPIPTDEGISAKKKHTRPQSDTPRMAPALDSASLSNLTPSTQVTKTMTEPVVARSLTATSGSGAGGSSGGLSEKETPVLPLYNSLPFRDVTQTSFKNQYFFSVNNLQWISGDEPMGLSTTNRVLKIRMNDFRNAWKASISQQTAGAGVVDGISTNAMVGRYVVDTTGGWFNPTALVPFPETNNSPQDYLPQMSKYFQNLYNAMTIVGCKWRLHVDFPNPELSADLSIGVTTQDAFALNLQTPAFVSTNSAYVQNDVASTNNTLSGATAAFNSALRNQSGVSSLVAPPGTTTAGGNTPLYTFGGAGPGDTYNKYYGEDTLYSGTTVPQRTMTTPNVTSVISNASAAPLSSTTATSDWRPKYSPRPAGARVSVHYETKAATGPGSVSGALESNMPVPCHIMDMERWPAIVDKHTLYNADRGNNGSSHHVFSGSWKPNWQNHNPLNDDQIKTWIPTSGASNNFEENLVIQFFRSWDTAKNANEVIGLNCWLEVDYDVQFRGLKESVMWPLQNQKYEYTTTAQTSVDLSMPQTSYYTFTSGGTFPPGTGGTGGRNNG